MFRSFIYLDEDKLYAYKSIVDGKDTPQNRTYTKTSRTGISSEKLPVSLSTNRETQESGSFSRNIDLDYQKFEERLSNFEGDEYFNFVLNEDQYDYGNLPLMSLIKIRGTIEIPEAFDILNVVQQFKPFLLKSIPQTDVSTELAKEVFTNAKADIPIIFDTGEYLISAKLNSKWLMEDYTDLENYQDQEVTLLCKVEGCVHREKVVVYDPIKDFIRLNRAMRQSANLEGKEGLEPITVPGPVLKVEIVAIYK